VYRVTCTILTAAKMWCLGGFVNFELTPVGWSLIEWLPEQSLYL
jgi:hypothetical protein